MSFDFSEFDKKVDLEGLKKDITEANTGSDGEYEDVPVGTYDVSIEKMELVMTKTPPARPMMSIWFKINAGEYKGQLIFMNQVLVHPFALHISQEFLKSLGTNIEIKFDSYDQYKNLILDCYEEIENQKEYALEYSKNAKGFDEFKILEVFNK